MTTAKTCSRVAVAELPDPPCGRLPAAKLAEKKQKEEIEFRASGQERRYSWDYDPSYDIFEANRDRIRNPDLIFPNQLFIIPQGDAGAQP